MSRVVLCICTCRRPDGLARLLDAVARLQCDLELAVVVVENGPDLEGYRLCEARKATYRWPLTAVIEEQRGIPYARNKAVNTALQFNPEFIAMLDDDEWPRPDWLAQMLRVQQAVNGDAVGGPQVPVFPQGAEPWSELPDYYGVNQGLAEGSPCVLYSSGNFLIRTACLQPYLPQPFDPQLAKSGVDDMDLFRRLDRDGARMFWAPNAIAFEEVPASRLSYRWLSERQRRIGNTNVLVQRRFAPGPVHEFVRLGKTAGLLFYSAALYVFALPFRMRRIRALLLFNKALGKVYGHMGNQQEYSGHGG